MEIRITKNTNPAVKPADEKALGFGSIFTDHMFAMLWDKDVGWHDAEILPFGPISLSPASSVSSFRRMAPETAICLICSFSMWKTCSRCAREVEL